MQPPLVPANRSPTVGVDKSVFGRRVRLVEEVRQATSDLFGLLRSGHDQAGFSIAVLALAVSAMRYLR